LTPAKLKPVPLGVICEIVSAAPPEFVRVAGRVLVLPVATVPKLRLGGFAVSCPGVNPVPDSGKYRVELDALEVIARLPLKLPLELGEKVTLKLTLWPTLRVNGKVNPLSLNPEPVALAAETVMLPPPELVRVSTSVCEPPT
jgi:hypothetical protein